VNPTEATLNRWVLEAPAGAKWIRIAQNWHAGWKWKSAGGDWQATRKGPDGATWIDLPSGPGQRVELKFFPRPVLLGCVSGGVALIWLLCTGIAAVRRMRSDAVTPASR
jgi:hypothetical protein